MKKLAVCSILLFILSCELRTRPQQAVDGLYEPTYPCVIFEGPRIKFILQEPCGEITVEIEPWIPPKMKED